MNLSCRERASSFEFTQEEIDEAVRRGGLLSMEIEFTQRCNFQCVYCYVPGKSWGGQELTQEELRGTVGQARDLGARKIILLGGEPMLSPHVLDMIGFIRGLGMEVEIFTNGTGVTPEVARQFAQAGVTVILKLNSLRPELQDQLTSVPGAAEVIRQAFLSLKGAGYPSEQARLAVSTVICNPNVQEIPEIWKWARDQDIEPYVEMMTPQGNASLNPWLGVDPERCRDLFEALAELDRTRYSLSWQPQPPLVGHRCLRHLFSCLVNAFGYVLPCVGVTLPVGNVRDKKLGDILKESQVIRDLRRYRETIKGPCRACEKLETCYGCRGAAYQLTGDPLASDPLCWENLDRQSEIVTLPTPAEGFIPQKSPMRVVERIISLSDKGGVVEIHISDESPFAGEDGGLDEAIHFELMAQSVAALRGFNARSGEGASRNGLLLGASHLKILGQARSGETLRVSVATVSEYGEFALIQGTVSRNGDVLAAGEIKVWTGR